VSVQLFFIAIKMGKNKKCGYKRKKIKDTEMANVNPEYGLWSERLVELYSFKPGSSIQKPVGQAFNMVGKCVQAVFLNMVVLMVIVSSGQILPRETSIHNKNPKYKDMYLSPDQYYWIKGHVQDNISNSVINALVIKKDVYWTEVNQMCSTPPDAHVVRSLSLNTYAICSTSKQHEGLPVEALDHLRTVHHVTLEATKPIPQRYKPTKDTSDRAGCPFRVDEEDATIPPQQKVFDVMYRESRHQANAAAFMNCAGTSIDIVIQIAGNHLVIDTKRVRKPSNAVTVLDGPSGPTLLTPHIQAQRLAMVPVQSKMPTNSTLVIHSPTVIVQPVGISSSPELESVPWLLEDLTPEQDFALEQDLAEPFLHDAYVQRILDREPLRNMPVCVDCVELGEPVEEDDVEYSNFSPAYLARLYKNADLLEIKEMSDSMNHRN
jgi:hypothetical protein